MYPDSSRDLNIEDDGMVYFFTPAFAPLDNFSAHVIEIWGYKFPTAEHAYQWKKFSVVNPEVAELILNSTSPHAAKEISNAHKSEQPNNWHQEKIPVMEIILRSKAMQHSDVVDILRKTKQKQIAENSPVDGFWGLGSNRNGENHIGKIWMKIRDEIN